HEGAPDARDREQRLGDERACDQKGERRAEGRDDGDQRVLEHMPHDNKSGFETLGPGRADEVLAERIERARPGQASDISGRQGGGHPGADSDRYEQDECDRPQRERVGPALKDPVRDVLPRRLERVPEVKVDDAPYVGQELLGGRLVQTYLTFRLFTTWGESCL